MKKLALIGGTGLYQLTDYKIVKEHEIKSQYGATSTKIYEVSLNNSFIYFLSRHGEQHQIAPHLINYRANIDALKQCGVTDIVSINAVGGINSKCSPASIALPNQIIDYTHSREHTFFDANKKVSYCDFSQPYSPTLQLYIKNILNKLNISYFDGGVYGCTQGPRLETVAEIKRMRNDGCDLVGMTAMPEAILAKEAGINYMSCCIVVNWAAGINGESIDMEAIQQNLNIGMQKIAKLIAQLNLSN